MRQIVIRIGFYKHSFHVVRYPAICRAPDIADIFIHSTISLMGLAKKSRHPKKIG